MTLSITSITPFTWTSNPFTWAAPDSALETWDTAAVYVETNTLAETLNNADSVGKGVTTKQSDAWSQTDAGVRSVTKKTAETLANAEVFYKEGTPNFLETLGTVEVTKLGSVKPNPETLNLADVRKATLTKKLSDAFASADSRFASVMRMLSESLTSTEGIRRTTTKGLPETTNIVAPMLRQGPAIISNLVLRNDVLTFDQFLAEDHTSIGTGYGPYVPFVPGDYDLSKALIKVSLKRQSVSQDLRVTVGKIFADRPIVTATGSLTTSTGGVTHVTFATPFVNIPVVNATTVATTGNGVPRISNITKTGFDIDVVDSTNTRLAAVVGWIAQGY